MPPSSSKPAAGRQQPGASQSMSQYLHGTLRGLVELPALPHNRHDSLDDSGAAPGNGTSGPLAGDENGAALNNGALTLHPLPPFNSRMTSKLVARSWLIVDWLQIARCELYKIKIGCRLHGAIRAVIRWMLPRCVIRG